MDYREDRTKSFVIIVTSFIFYRPVVSFRDVHRGWECAGVRLNVPMAIRQAGDGSAMAFCQLNQDTCVIELWTVSVS